MAWIKPYETKDRRNGKPVKSYVVIWKEPAWDEFGLPIPADPARPGGRKKQVQQQETYPNREAAEARRDELNAARHTTGTSALATARKAGDLPYGYYARAWLDSLQVKVAQGRLKQSTLDGYEQILQRYALKRFGAKAIAAITPRDCEEFLSALVRQQSRQGTQGDVLSPATVKHAWGTFRRVLKYALRHDAIPSNAADRVDYDTNRATGDHEEFEHNPLTAEQVARLSAAVAGGGIPAGQPDLPAYPVYALMVDFLAYTGLRASENAGLEVHDLEFHTAPAGKSLRPGKPTRKTPVTALGQTPDSLAPNTIRCTVHIRRTKSRKNTGTPGEPHGSPVRRSPSAASEPCPSRPGWPPGCTPTSTADRAVIRPYTTHARPSPPRPCGPAARTVAGTEPRGSATPCRWTGPSRWPWERSTTPSSARRSSRWGCPPLLPPYRRNPPRPPVPHSPPSPRRAAYACTTCGTPSR
ncbi:tyrosine-type recombinase/integrase [Nocardia aurantia]|uniref:Core-binding (CB) domain-containing protein n=1 Tax=Nocardia aurantia TaxID=2585199 RepID=A0A7K0DHS2_9NOCA|nr:site-specific integrase [Nocardia aurantia]MQY25121.1 hypothetical protein [Nocardia aurantia]